MNILNPKTGSDIHIDHPKGGFHLEIGKTIKVKKAFGEYLLKTFGFLQEFKEVKEEKKVKKVKKSK